MTNIASAMPVFKLYSCVTTTAFMPIGQQPIRVMIAISSGSLVKKTAMMYERTGMIRNRIGITDAAMYLYMRAALKFRR